MTQPSINPRPLTDQAAAIPSSWADQFLSNSTVSHWQLQLKGGNNSQLEFSGVHHHH